MAFCEDPSLTYLNHLGYNVIRLPRTGVAPLEVLGSERGKPPEPLGPLSTVWQASIEIPAVTQGDATNISGHATNDMKLSFGLKLLETVLGAMGAAAPKIKASYSQANKVKFEFKNPEIQTISPLVVGNYLAHGDLNTDNPTVERYFFDEQMRAFLVTEVLYSRSIRVTASSASSTGVELDVKVLQDSVGGNVDVTVNSATEGDLIYTGKKLLAFGYKAHEIAFDGSQWSLRRVNPSKNTSLLAEKPEELAAPVLFAGDDFWGGPR